MSNSGTRLKSMMVFICAMVLTFSGLAMADPLHDAAKEGNLAEAKRLIEEGDDVNVKNDRGATPLHFAATRGHKDIAELLISKGADVNAETKTGYTPLHWAAMEDHKDVAELLISKGANVNADSTPIKATPLYWAARTGCKNTAELLISKGANVNAKTRNVTLYLLKLLVRILYSFFAKMSHLGLCILVLPQ